MNDGADRGTTHAVVGSQWQASERAGESRESGPPSRKQQRAAGNGETKSHTTNQGSYLAVLQRTQYRLEGGGFESALNAAPLSVLFS